jgi:hypothetical protein
MKNLITQFQVLFNNHDGFRRQVGDYSRAMKTEEWKFLTDAIGIIQGQMALDMFSLAHTKLTPGEKDVVQKTYYNTNQILDFLANPQGWISKRESKKKKYTDLNKGEKK